MTMHHYTLVRLNGSLLERIDFIGSPAGIPAGWSIHKRSAKR